MEVIHFGSSSEFIKIRVPKSFSSDGFGQVEVEIAVNCFHGVVTPWFDLVDFELFTKKLRTVYDLLTGQAELKPLDSQFIFMVLCKSNGHILFTGEAWSRATYENKLSFEFELDQSFLREPLLELERLCGV